MPERTLKITCDECGYSEEVPYASLAYEEAKACPRCRKGKMWWVPPAEEARRREVMKMEEERRISPAVVIVGGLGLGLAAAVGIAALAMAVPPTVYTCPHCGAEFDTEEELLAHIELEHPELPPPALATLYGRVADAATGEPLVDVLGTLNGLEFYTDAGGNYAFTDLEPGSYTITFEKEGYETVVSDVILDEGNNELNAQMTPIPPPVANLYGLVTDAQTDYPLSGVKVTIDGLVIYTDASANYRFEGLSPGSYTITFEKEGYETVVSDIILVAGNNELNVEMVPIAAPPAFTFGTPWLIAYPSTVISGAYYFDFGCTITNPNNVSVEHDLKVMMHQYGYEGQDLGVRAVKSFHLALTPGEIYEYAVRLGMIMGGWELEYWLEDELGNKSGEVYFHT